MKFSRLALCAFLLCAPMASCIREDMSSCYSTNYLMLSYTGDGQTEIFNRKVCRVEMFIFDSEDRVVSSSVLPNADLQARKTVLPPLHAGEYRVVCIGNTHNTEIRNLPVKSAPYDDIIFADRNYFSGNTVSGNDSLYFASLPYTVREFDAREEDQVKTAEFRSSHYDVVIEVAGVPDPGNASRLPHIEMSGLQPCTDFVNSACGDKATYIPEISYDAGKTTMTASFNIMRHTAHDDVDIFVHDSAGKVLAEVNLGDFLRSHPVIDCTLQEALIPIRIEFISGSVSIALPDWYIQDVKPEF